jgi:beta-lactamase regulating signal transducer with metallopeptidase domain
VIQLFAFAVGAAIRATVLLLGAAGLAALLRKRTAALQHALWTAAMAASLVIPVLSATLPSLSIRSPVSVSAPAPKVLATGARAARPLFDVGAIFTSTPSDGGSASRIREALLLVWLVGLALCLSRILRSSLAVIRLRRSATEVSDERITFVWRQLQRSSLSRTVLLVEADSVTAPGTAGIIRPTIFLPREAAEWGSIRIRATLAHEYAHIVRRDCLTHLLADLAVAIYWFNPIVWYARRRMTTERERACDDLVLSDGVRPERYASVLVQTVRGSLLHQNVRAPGMLSMARPSELEKRLVSILDPSRSRGRMSSRATVVTGSIVTATAVLISVSQLDAATIDPQAGSRVITAETVARLHSLQDSGEEPDRRGDSIASPLSERVGFSAEIWSAARNTAALRGPDSLLARNLYSQLSRSPSWEGDLVRDRSAWALSRQRTGLLIDPLIESLGDRDWRIRAYAAWALAESGASRAVPALVVLLSDPNWRMRAMAAYALDAIGDESVAAAMAGAAQDEAWQVRVSAVHFIGALHNAKYQSLLDTALADRHVAVRGAASAALDNPLSHR